MNEEDERNDKMSMNMKTNDNMKYGYILMKLSEKEILMW